MTASAIREMESAIPACAVEPQNDKRALHMVGAYRYNGILAIEHDAPRKVKACDHIHA